MTLNANGFDRKRLPEIKTELDAAFNAALGPVNTEPDSVTGQLIGIFAEAIDAAYEILQDNYDSMYPYSAENTSLDGAVSYVGMTRLPASATVVTCAAYGDESDLVPVGSLATVGTSEFESTSDVVISRANALDVEIEVNTVAEAPFSYQIVAGGVSVTYSSGVDETAAEIIAGLAALMDDEVYVISYTDTTLRFYAIDGVSPFSLTVDAKLDITRRASPVVFVCQDTGAVAAPVGAMTVTSTGVELYNLVAGDIGRDVESDAALRARHLISTRGTGSATVEAIKAKLLANVDGVTSVAIYENRTALEVDGMPAHSYETVIEGGTNSEIAAEIWLTKPAGIETYGNETVLTPDTAGDNQTVSFSRPVPVYGWVRVDVTTLNEEEALPSTAEQGIKDAVVAYANAEIGVGEDVIIQRFHGPIYDAVPGLARLDIDIDVTALDSDTPVYTSANAAVGRAEIAVFSTDRVTVLGL